MTVLPVRLQLSRTKGFDLQASSRALNGLSAVKVDRSTKWGNWFRPGHECPGLPGVRVADQRHAFLLYKASAPLNADLVAMAREKLAGKNLACWCPKDDPYEDCCHAAVLLRLANPALAA